MDQSQLDALYQQYLGRGVDPNGAVNWANADYNTVVQGILGSQEYQNRQNAPIGAVNVNTGQSSGPATNQGGGADAQAIYAPNLPSRPSELTVLPNNINDIYRKYLGRDVDPSGAATYAGWTPEQIAGAVINSPEYQQRIGASGGSPQSGANTSAQDLANQVYGAYKTNANYDKALNELNALPQNADYYRARLGLIGKMMGWQIGQNTGDRNTVYQKELESYLPGAKAAGLTDAEINNLISQNSAASNQENQRRIAEEAAKGKGWVNQNIPGGWATVAAAAALAAGGLGAAGLLGEGALGAGTAGALETTGAGGLAGGGAFIPAVGSGASFSIIPEAAYTVAGGLGAAAGDAAWGLTPELAQELGLDYSTSGLTDLSGEAGSRLLEELGLNTGMSLPSWLSAANLASALKGGQTLAGAAKSLGLLGTLGSSGTAGLGGSSATNQNALANALKNIGSSAGGTQTASNFGLMKGNVNPFTYAKDVPVQTVATNKTDPFAALNVAQTPVQPINPLAHLFG